MSLYENQTHWKPPESQRDIFVPEGAPSFLEVEWEYLKGQGIAILDVTINGNTVMHHLSPSDIEALTEEAMTKVEGGVR